MNSKKKPVVKSLSTKPKKRIVRDASPAPDLPLDGTQRKLAEGALQDDRAGMEKVIEKAKINKEKLVAELVIANKELNFQNKEKEKRAAELVIANKELAFQNQEKEKRAAELVIANKELVFKITEHEQAEETIRSLALFPSENPNPVLRIARDGNLLYGNPAAFTLLKKWKLRVGKPAPEVLKNLTNEALETETTKMVDIPCGDRIFSISIAPAPEGEYINLYARDVTERKQAEEELRESEALLNEVGVIAKLGGWEMDITTGKATWSKGTYDIVEIEYNKPVPGLHEHVGYYLPEYREMIESKMNALIETKQPMKFEAELKTAKGNIKWCQALGEAVVKDGKLIKLRGTFQDITERKMAEEALRESEHLIRIVADNVPVLISYMDQDRRYRFVNQHYAENFGKRVEDMIGKPYWEVVGEAYYRATLENINAAFSGQRVSYETTIDFPETGLHWLAVTYMADIDELGKVNGIFIAAYDITERKRAEGTLRESEQTYKALIETTSTGYLIINVQGQVLDANAEYVRLTGMQLCTRFWEEA